MCASVKRRTPAPAHALVPAAATECFLQPRCITRRAVDFAAQVASAGLLAAHTEPAGQSAASRPDISTKEHRVLLLPIALQDAAEEDVGEEAEAEDTDIYATYRWAGSSSHWQQCSSTSSSCASGGTWQQQPPPCQWRHLAAAAAAAALPEGALACLCVSSNAHWHCCFMN